MCISKFLLASGLTLALCSAAVAGQTRDHRNGSSTAGRGNGRPQSNSWRLWRRRRLSLSKHY
jgi:hypothetical protein